jgi:uncharacterized protein YdaU (DUF1376 family)
MASYPAFLLYSRDWIEGTAEMMPNEKGVFIDLLCYQHQRGGIPCDTARIARMAGLSQEEFNIIWQTLKSKFIPLGDVLVNPKLASIIEESNISAKKKRIAGMFSALCKQQTLDKSIYVGIKKRFKSDMFLEFSDDVLMLEMESWFNSTLSSLINT